MIMLNNIKLFAFLCFITQCAPIPNQVRGIPGKDGMNGIDGAHGHSSLVNIYPATEDQCENGGSVIISALDVNGSLSIDAEDSNQQMGVICNGSNAPVTPMEPIELITPCDDGNLNRQVVVKLPSFETFTTMSNGAQYNKPRIVKLGNGSHSTKDGFNCSFSVTKTPTSLTIEWGNVTLNWGNM